MFPSLFFRRRMIYCFSIRPFNPLRERIFDIHLSQTISRLNSHLYYILLNVWWNVSPTLQFTQLDWNFWGGKYILLKSDAQMIPVVGQLFQIVNITVHVNQLQPISFWIIVLGTWFMTHRPFGITWFHFIF